ncbi:hypothetical protein QQS45_06725 [Alteriqipengyuania flavescens]|uniref:hypothetical protein n=1 Tax=Alteriqipengyuania flavescens TaxID=3053610 RepID=UPI0025B62989|nr:hypothetical protein [Alteriqipengyuania flavescens]WJY19900.1 hypothetical protein QQW98_06715 [Alteriqipengyuania flavescens]WJY25844.1 hypothetical protein QQS45_06725 [Alteriqipengyuania flavescens]
MTDASIRVTGWKLDRDDRAALLKRFPPVWPDIIADHVTLDPSATKDAALPDADFGEVVGHVNDRNGLQALVVAIDGSTDRPDGSIYHITWSIDRAQGREPKDSNDVLADQGWEEINSPVQIRLIPARWP